MSEMTPREIVTQLDQHIVGQADAKRAVAIALRNRWRWKQLSDDIRREITPKNIIMIGPTGVGKTEITRRLAKLLGSPFIKVEATKYTEVGYYGRDVESIVRDLVEAAINMVKSRKRIEVELPAKERVEERLLELLVPAPDWSIDDEERSEAEQRHERTLEKFRAMLRAGELEERPVELHVEQRHSPVQVFSNMGMEQMDVDLQSMFERIIPKQSTDRNVTVAEARKILFEQEVEGLMDKDAIQEEAVSLCEESGIIFIDEIDKVCGPEGGGGKNADVSRQGVQRDLLPIVEGTTVQTRYGSVSTEHMLFIAAGAFHRSKPSDLMPELQGRFPIRVELTDLTRDDFIRILTEPSASLTRQYQELLSVDGVKVSFTEDGIEEVADIAFQVNQSTQNIGARRLQTILERLLEDVSFAAPDPEHATVVVDREYVRDKLDSVLKDEDLSKFIL
ncbi:MAG: ATP-dependent protease ATPase subunit HslU [Planctomycetota bacterium]|nr:ATP-dependent protease ATPase subunit HslU [Planctomycetota bacterium]